MTARSGPVDPTAANDVTRQQETTPMTVLDDPALTEGITLAARRIAPHVRRTPVLRLEAGAFGVENRLTLKLEQLQHSGTFKMRGAINSLLSATVPDGGVIAASGGNHGAAVALAASRLGHAAEIFVPTIASPAKVERLRNYGARVHQIGAEFAETLAACEARGRETGAMSIHAYDQTTTVLGQGTVGREFEQDAPELDTVLVAVGGGGLIGGIAGWYQGRARVVAVETTGTSALHSARAAARPVDVAVSGIAADSLGARRIGTIAFDIASRHVDDAVLVDDDAVRHACRALWQLLRLAVEPAAASVVAALMSGAYRPAADEHVGLVICGANTDFETLARLTA